MKPLPLITTVFVAAFLAACNKPEEKASDDSSAGSSGLKAYLLDTAPAGAVTITEAREDPTPGKEVVISGKIMGTPKPLADGRAILTLGDPTKLTSCDLIPDDHCETPWDACCDLPEERAAGIASVQIVGEDGQPLKESFRGLGGIQELSSLVVKGTVAEGSNQDNFLVNATGIHVAMAEPTKENPAQP